MAKFTEEPYRGAMLILLDGSSAVAPRKTCGTCGRPMLRVFVTAGARARAPLSESQDACITKKWTLGLPCPRALQSIVLIDTMMDVVRS